MDSQVHFSLNGGYTLFPNNRVSIVLNGVDINEAGNPNYLSQNDLDNYTDKKNISGDLIPPDDLYEACRVMARHVRQVGDWEWDFSELHTCPIDPAFTRLVESYLSSVLGSDAEHRGWKLPETTLIYPWIVRMFPDIKYIRWIRDPRDGFHVKRMQRKEGCYKSALPQCAGHSLEN